MPPISVLIKPASGICNMSCEYCFYCDEAQKRQQEFYGFMTEETLKNVIRKTMLHAEGAVSYIFQGGEPTLRGIEFYKKLLEFQKRFNKNRISVMNSIQTNGYDVNEEWCEFLKKHHFLVGLSLDGTKECHDKYRHGKNGQGSYERVIQTAKRFDDYEIPYNILTVVNQKTALHVREIYENYSRNGWKYQQYIACLDPLGEEHGHHDYALSPEAYGEFLIQLFNLWYEDCLKNRQPYIRRFYNYLGILTGRLPESCDQRGKCSIQYVVEANGDVFPCDFYMLDEYRLGNFNYARIPEMDRKRTDIGFVERSNMISAKCKECPYYSLCRGGCYRTRDMCKNEGEYLDYFCQSYQMFFRECQDRLKKLAEGKVLV